MKSNFEIIMAAGCSITVGVVVFFAGTPILETVQDAINYSRGGGTKTTQVYR